MKTLLPYLLLFCVLNANGLELGGLILYGVDTINTKNQYGFDFVAQKSCTVGINNAPFACVNHFLFTSGVNQYNLVPDAQDGPAYCISMGKMNLDSIKTAPADSIFTKQPNGHGDDIPADSLSSRIGNVYLMKTATDPRPAFNNAFYAKIRILKFNVIDSAQHQIKMVFLWAFNISGLPDLTTSGLDTFHLDGTTLNQPNSRFANSNNSRQSDILITQRSSTVSFALSANSTIIGIYDIDGRLVVKLPVPNGTAVWQGTSAAAKPVSAGRYFARVLEGKQNITKAFLLVR
jgi:hypothetical protein